MKDGQSPPMQEVTAIHLGRPAYQRSGFLSGGDEMRIQGLGPGRFRVQGFAVTGGPTIDEEIESDGRSSVERTVDLR